MTWRFRLTHGISASQRDIALPRQPKLYQPPNIQGADMSAVAAVIEAEADPFATRVAEARARSEANRLEVIQ